METFSDSPLDGERQTRAVDSGREEPLAADRTVHGESLPLAQATRPVVASDTIAFMDVPW